MQKRSLIRAGGVVLAGALAWSFVAPAHAAGTPEPAREEAGTIAETLQAQLAAGYVRTGRQHLENGNLTQAAADFRAALAIAPALAAAREGLARVDARMKDQPAGAPPAAAPARPAVPEAAAPAEPEAPPKAPAPVVEEPAPRPADGMIQKHASLLRAVALARRLLSQQKFTESGKEYEAVLKTAAALAERTDVSRIQAEARHGLRLAREGVLAKIASRPAPAPERPAAPAPVAAAPAPAPAAPVVAERPSPVPARIAPPAEEKAAAEPDAVAEFDEAIRDVGRMMQPQSEILSHRDLGERMAPLIRPKTDTTTQKIGRHGSESTEDQDAAKEILAKMLKYVSVKFKDEPFERVMDYMREVAKVNIVVDPTVRPTARPVSFSATNMQLTNVFHWVLRQERLDYRIRHGAIYISNSDGLREEPVQEIHDISDLTLRLKDFRNAGEDPISVPMLGRDALSVMAPNGRDDKEEVERTREGEEWARFVRENVAPLSWSSAEGGVLQNTIAYRNGKLVVTHQPEVQERIRELLASFRKARAIQVAILARFIEINDDFLDDLGVQWAQLSAADDAFGIKYAGSGSVFFRAGFSADAEVGLGTVFATTDGLTLETGFLNTWQVKIIVNAVRKHKKGNILTAPRVTCFNTQQAYLTVSTRTGYVRSYDADGNPEIGQVNNGIIFQVQPWVSADRRYITLEMHPQVNIASDFQEFTFNRDVDDGRGTDGVDNDGDGEIDEADEAQLDQQKIQLPEVTVRVVRTTVSVPDGGTLMIGGLAEATEAEGFATVPILGDLPLIGHLFTTRRKLDARKNLIILVTAHIIEQRED